MPERMKKQPIQVARPASSPITTTMLPATRTHRLDGNNLKARAGGRRGRGVVCATSMPRAGQALASRTCNRRACTSSCQPCGFECRGCRQPQETHQDPHRDRCHDSADGMGTLHRETHDRRETKRFVKFTNRLLHVVRFTNRVFHEPCVSHGSFHEPCVSHGPHEPICRDRRGDNGGPCASPINLLVNIHFNWQLSTSSNNGGGITNGDGRTAPTARSRGHDGNNSSE